MPDLPKKMLCPDCATEIPADAKRCPKCDYPISAHSDLSRVFKNLNAEGGSKKKDEPSVFESIFGR